MKKPRHETRDAQGLFTKSPPCDGCGKPVGTEPLCDDEVCGSSDGPGFNICHRKRCSNKLNSMSPKERFDLYYQMRLSFKELTND